MNYLLDTNILIYLIKNRPPSIADKVNALDDADGLNMSFVTYAELLKGAERSTRKAHVLSRLDGLAQQIPVLYPTNSAICRHYADTMPTLCRHYAEQFTRLKTAGTPIGGNDLWIACHALAIEATLVTHNTREFERVEGLAVEDWVR